MGKRMVGLMRILSLCAVVLGLVLLALFIPSVADAQEGQPPAAPTNSAEALDAPRGGK